MGTCLLDRILAPDGISIVFQPIVEVHGREQRLHALECLTRGPAGTSLQSPTVLFEYVRRKGEEAAVDRACIAAALRESAPLPPSVRLSLNAHASTLGRDAGFADFVDATARAHGIDAARITIEIVEHAPPHDVPAFALALDRLRALGMRIALDDVGLGHSNYKMIVDSRPDYFKIDRYFVRDADGDPYRIAVLDSVARLAERVGARVVAEGIEHLADFEAVTRLGIDLLQGYRFSPPLSAREVSFYPLLLSA
jgi:EAL domain-containing protein (putative c-di-GMP-specific phosphodiesterase class I)